MAWRTLLGLGLVGVVSAAAVGCTAEVKVNGGTNDGGPDSTTSTGGKGTGGGTSTGGKGTGGGTSTGGGTNTGGGTSTGGAGGDSGPTTCDTTVTDSCQKCINTNCCAELNDCVDARCGGTLPDGSDGELACMQTCLQNGFANKDGGATTLSDCSDKCKGSNAVLAQTTQAVITCMTQRAGDSGTGAQLCSTDCFGGEPQ